MLTESPIHHVAFLNYFLAYNASFFERSDGKWPIEELCTRICVIGFACS